MVDASVTAAVRKYLQALRREGIAVHFGVVFGSWATGRADRWSDIDLLVVSPDYDRPIRRPDVDALWHLAAQTDSRIEPVPCGERAWREDDSSALIEQARREGERVGIGSDMTPRPGG